MEILFKSQGREFKANYEQIDDIYEAVKDGLVAMGFHKNTANEFYKDLKEGKEF